MFGENKRLPDLAGWAVKCAIYRSIHLVKR